MAEELFAYGVYSIHVRPIELAGSRWDAEYEIRQHDKPMQRWTTVGGDAGYESVADAIEGGAPAGAVRHRARRRGTQAEGVPLIA